MKHIEMLSIDGLEDAVLGTGFALYGQEVLVYDGYVAEQLNFHIGDYMDQLEESGMAHMAPIFIYLDKGVRAEVVGNHRPLH